MPQLFAFIHFLFSLQLSCIILKGIRLLCTVRIDPRLQLPTVECCSGKRMLYWLPLLSLVYLSRLLPLLRVAPGLPQREGSYRELQRAMEELLFVEAIWGAHEGFLY
ncbi:hypothetical protein ACFQUU_02420 [Herbaspirillum sp. GCM10030257]|uniref:hypothetical protein n=1 Tax=Herbaspirillum sp. GCM10030257 TaxID=3273393 RepID=UPI0036204F03